jgi:predicted dehydrogenase
LTNNIINLEGNILMKTETNQSDKKKRRFHFVEEVPDEQNVRLGISGVGTEPRFYFHEHPNCEVVAVAGNLSQQELERAQNVYGASRAYTTVDELLEAPDIDAVFTLASIPERAGEVIKILQAGKHVLSMDNAAMTLEECRQLKEAVERSGLIYMMAETSVYRQNTLSAKKYYREGRFGDLFSVEASYIHPGIEYYWYDADGNPTWHRGFPPIQYITHCTSFLISVTGERLTHVSCLGWGDDNDLLAGNAYDNPFWNQTALFKTNRGNSLRVNVWRKGAVRGTERAEWYGDKMSFYSGHPNGLGPVLVHSVRDDDGFTLQQPNIEPYDQPLYWQTDMLPEPLRHDSGHGGSHTFITHEFIDSVLNNRHPEVDIYMALACTAPGIVAHQSALNEGRWMEIPDFDP